jgi:dephospho-CoA kinase
VVNDVPLLVEVGLAATYHLVTVVHTAEPIRLERLARDRGMSAEEARRRIAAQADDTRRQAAADVVLTNDGGLDDLHTRVDRLWRDRLLPYERNLRDRTPVRLSRVVLSDPDPTWPAQYARIAARLRHALAPATPRIDHIGSTSVPGLAAKDVVDIQLTVPSLAEADGHLAEQLAGAGFPRCPGQWWDSSRHGDGGRWDKRLHGSADPGRPVNLHLRVADTPGWRYALLMRDHLRADAGRRDAYQAVKRELAAADPDPVSYATAKEPWFDEEYRVAQRWAESTGWRP